ncbi:unnamed protein product [Toxocara canis]|uniref:Uncharacterized protein n=1 Tax=Toxocara canis TaxID=6265 RepID=A0A183TZ89_TOXCA|nr:unnamed protein product [Toxocara canis]
MIRSMYIVDTHTLLNRYGFHLRKLSKQMLNMHRANLPSITKKEISNGQYFEFEKVANGLDGYFDGSSESEDELGANEDNSFNFEMCRVRRTRRPRNSPLTSCADQKGMPAEEDIMRPQLLPVEEMTRNEFIIDAETLDIEDALCVVREGFSTAPPLAQEDDFDDFEI